MRALLLVVGLWLLGVVEAAAQTCLGVASADGQTALAMEAGFSQESRLYGISVAANLHGPLSLSGGWSLIKTRDISTNGDGLGVALAFVLPVPRAFLCPTVGAALTRSQRFDGRALVTISRTSIPVGFSVGERITVGSDLSLTGYVKPQFLFTRTSLAYESGDFIGTDEEGALKGSEFGLDTGLRLSSRTIFVGGALGLTTLDDDDPRFTATVGMLVGE